jgi:glycosyltransferase involved in cell wall biosynthesis
MKIKRTVGYVTASDPRDKRSWSGIHNKMYESLLKQFDEVIILGPIKKSRLVEKLLRTLNIIHLKLFKKKFNKHHNITLSKYYASKITTNLKNKNVDVLFAPASPTEIAFLKTSIPICYLSDTSFGQLNEYYKGFTGISALSVKESNLIEQRAISNSKTQVYSSDWAAHYVLKNYTSDKNYVFTLKFGANIDFVPNKLDINKEFRRTINLLFLSVEWERKGGDIALEAFEILLNKGYDITLTICGCTPPKKINNPRIKVVPYLNKNVKSDNECFLKILQHTHIMIVPTRADCTPIAFCEASAFGIPVITTDTGGISSIIENGLNGYALPLDSNPLDYATKIQELLDDPNKMKELSAKSRTKFEEELNWDIWAKKMKEILILTMETSIVSIKSN